MNYIKHTSISYLTKNHLIRKELDFERLCRSARQNGYIVRKYSDSYSMLIMLNLYERACKSASVCLRDQSGNVYIFIDDTLPQNKQLFALAHEIGHLWLEHKPDTTHHRRQEREANLFAHYLITGAAPPKHYILLATAILCLLFTATMLFLELISKSPSQQLPSEERPVISSAPAELPSDAEVCYYTPNGTVYHIYRDCSYLKNSKTVLTSDIENCPKDRLCSRCADR